MTDEGREAERGATEKPKEWKAIDPCYGACSSLSMPCTPEGCPENHPVGRRVLVGPRALEVDSDGGVEFESEEETLVLAAAKKLLAACQAFIAWDKGPHLTDSSLEEVRAAIYADVAGVTEGEEK